MTMLPFGLRLLRSDESGVVLELTTPSYEVAAETLPAGTFHRLAVPGYGVTAEPGKPQVPLIGALLGVPADAAFELHVLKDEALTLPGTFLLRPAPRPAPLADDLQPGRLLYKPDPATYASDAPYPATPARIGGDGFLRDQRFVRLELFPFQVNPAQGTFIWHRQLIVELRFHRSPSSWGAEVQGCEGAEQQGSGGARGQRSQRGHRDGYCIQDSAFEPVLRGVLLNYDSARAWRARPALSMGQKPGFSEKPGFSPTEPRYKIVVDRDGLYRLTYDDLRAAGMDVDAVDPRTFRLTTRGQDVAIYVAGEADGSFDPGDTIAFYGQKFRGTVMEEKYTDENVYWLTVGGQPGPRMAVKDGAPSDSAPVPPYFLTTVHAEESNVWWTWHFTSQDTWFWERVQTGPVAVYTATYTTPLSYPASGPLTATVRAEVVARSFAPQPGPDHHTRFYLNGGAEPLDDAYWEGRARYSFEAQVPQSQLREGVNQLDFVIVNDADLALDDIYFDWFEIEYHRQFLAEGDQLLFSGSEGIWQYEIGNFLTETVEVYDVTDPLAPQRVLNPRITVADGTYTVAFQDTQDAGARYLALGATAVQSPKRVTRYVPPDLRSPTNGADYILITHRDFYTATQTLAAYREAQGLRTIVVDVDDLYNEFNDGIFNPIAIKNFLAYAYANWQPPAPSYVLLVGDGHWNFKGYGVERYGPPEPIYMPPNLAWVDPWQGEVDSTNLLAAIVGDDILPDLHIGRLPVNSVEELNAVIGKIMAYESAGPQDLSLSGAKDWQRHVLFVADNVPDATGDFVRLSEGVIADHLPASFQAHRIYLNDYCGSPASPPRLCPAVNTAIVETLNQTGALLVNYIGHASVERWAHEQIFTTGDIASLSNGDRLPVVLSMTCLDGYWIYPNRPSLAEELLRAEDRGAVSTFSPTGLGVATGHDVLQRGFYTAVFQGGVRQLGPATLAGKLALYASGDNYDLIHTFTIFGDPALRLQVPLWRIYLPIIQE